METFRELINVATASSQTTGSERVSPKGEVQAPVRVLAPPGLLRCLILSWSDQRAKGLQSAAEKEAWETIVCSNAAKFIKHTFQQKVPLALVDLPHVEMAVYAEMHKATVKVCEVSDSLLIVCGAGENTSEELWARELGVWSYLPEVTQPSQLDWLFVEARKALAKQASSSFTKN